MMTTTNSATFADFVPIDCEASVSMTLDSMRARYDAWSLRLAGQALDELHGDLELNRREWSAAAVHYLKCDQNAWRIRAKLGFAANCVGDYETAADLLDSAAETGTVFDRILLVNALSEGGGWTPNFFDEEQQNPEEIRIRREKMWALIRSNVVDSACNAIGFLQVRLLPRHSEADKTFAIDALSRGVELFPWFPDLAAEYCARAGLDEYTRSIARRHIGGPYAGECHNWLMSAEYRAGNFEVALALSQQGMQESEDDAAWWAFALFSSQLLFEMGRIDEAGESLRQIAESKRNCDGDNTESVFEILTIKLAIAIGDPMGVEAVIQARCFAPDLPTLLQDSDLGEFRYATVGLKMGRVNFEQHGLTADEMYRALALVTSERSRSAIIVSLANLHDSENMCGPDPDARSPKIEALILDTWGKAKELWLADRVALLLAEMGKWKGAGEAWMRHAVYEHILDENGEVPPLPGNPKTNTKWRAFLNGASTAVGALVREKDTLACFHAWSGGLRAPVLERNLHADGLAFLTPIAKRVQSADVAFDHGLFLHHLNRKDEAAVAYRQCLSLNSTHTVAMSNLSMIARARMNIVEVKSILRMAEAVPPREGQTGEILNRMLTELRQWLQEHDVTDVISNWIEKYGPAENESYDIENLSLWNAIALLALYRAGDEVSEDFTLGAVDSTGTRLMPTSRLNSHVMSLIQCGWIFPSVTSPRGAFEIENGKIIGVYLTKMKWRLTPALIEFIRELENAALDCTSWPSMWNVEFGAVAKELAIDECKQYLDARMEEIGLTAPDGPKTNALIEAILERYSVGQAFYFVWTATKSVGDGLARYDRNLRRAANSFVSRCQGTFDKARSGQWKIESYSRSRSNPRSAATQVFQDLFLRMSDGDALALTVDQIVTRCGGVGDL